MATLWALIVTWVLVLPAIAASPCVGDCDGNGRVDIAELTVGIRLAMQRSSVDECLACDSDGNRAIEINELIAAVKAALSSCSPEPLPSATVTPTPQGTADPELEAAVSAATESVCRGSTARASASANSHGASGSCERGRGHTTRIMLRRYASSAEAMSIFEASIPLGTEETTFEGYRAAAWNEQYVARPDGHPEFRNLLWLIECWVVRARSFDDTPLNGAPSVESFSKAVLETAQNLLLARCD